MGTEEDLTEETGDLGEMETGNLGKKAKDTGEASAKGNLAGKEGLVKIDLGKIMKDGTQEDLAETEDTAAKTEADSGEKNTSKETEEDFR